MAGDDSGADDELDLDNGGGRDIDRYGRASECSLDLVWRLHLDVIA